MTITEVRARPCAKCPFRADVPNYLRSGRRVEIAESIARGEGFVCHETTVPGAEDEEGFSTRVEGPDSKLCAGAVKSALAAGGCPQNLRVMERLGMIDLDEIENTGAECLNLTEWASRSRGEGDGSDPDDDGDGEACSVCGPGCMAPAGHMIDGIAVPSNEVADNACMDCDAPVCSSCISAAGRCDECEEYALENPTEQENEHVG